MILGATPASRRLPRIIQTDDASIKSIHYVNVPDQALKKDMGKLRWDLVPLEAIEGLVKVLTFGAQKYEDNGWKGLKNDQERIHGAVMRHYAALRKGQTIDEESGLPHLDHMMCNLMFLKYFSLQETEDEG